MGSIVTYQLHGGIATITMDDGKVNVRSLPMQAAIHEALDRAVADRDGIVADAAAFAGGS